MIRDENPALIRLLFAHSGANLTPSVTGCLWGSKKEEATFKSARLLLSACSAPCRKERGKKKVQKKKESSPNMRRQWQHHVRRVVTPVGPAGQPSALTQTATSLISCSASQLWFSRYLAETNLEQSSAELHQITYWPLDACEGRSWVYLLYSHVV